MSALDDVRRALDEAYGTGVIFDGLTGADLLAAVVADTELACRDAVTKATASAATPDFFQPGRTYQRTRLGRSGSDVWTFTVACVTDSPDGRQAAIGFLSDGHGWVYGGQVDFAGWTEATEDGSYEDHGSIEDVYSASELAEYDRDTEYRLDAENDARNTAEYEAEQRGGDR